MEFEKCFSIFSDLIDKKFLKNISLKNKENNFSCENRKTKCMLQIYKCVQFKYNKSVIYTLGLSTQIAYSIYPKTSIQIHPPYIINIHHHTCQQVYWWLIDRNFNKQKYIKPWDILKFEINIIVEYSNNLYKHHYSINKR